MMADVGLKVRIAIHESAHAVCARVLRLRAGTIEGNMPLASFDDKGTSRGSLASAVALMAGTAGEPGHL
jgi:hypothetical protein